MTRILLRISYDGGAYGGWQVQPNAPTVQQRLQEAALDLFGAPTPVTGAGRTDSGVHALGQAAHLDTDRAIPAAKIAPALNARLPRDIRVTHSQRVPADFHARFSAHTKTYRYCYHVGEQPPALFRQYCFHAGPALDLAAMERAAGQLIGRHDFSAFQDVGRPVADATRALSAVALEARDPFVLLTVTGEGFLYHMVRIIAGTLWQVGLGKRPADLTAALAPGGRTACGPTAPAWGLTLVSVAYPPAQLGENPEK